MNSSTKTPADKPAKTGRPAGLDSRRAVLLCGCGLVLATLAAYSNSLAGPFIFDDAHAILTNPTIRHLSSLGKILSPPSGGSTVSGRPLLNLTLAVNYAVGGDRAVWSYHALNLLIHVLAGLTLFGLVRRTLLQPVLKERLSPAALSVAFSVALLWALHPLQTECVTYIVQRAESLMGLFYLLTLYCVVRAAESPASFPWKISAVTACLLGMASKEVMATAPLMALLYDRTFIAGTFREAWRRRRRLYLALAGTWLFLGWLIIGTGNRGGSAGFGVSVSPFDYARTQCWAVLHYLQLSVWPHPLVFDYGTGLIKDYGMVVPCALGLAALVAATGYGLWRRPVLGFLGGWFFIILAPSSSVVPVATQTIAEHRMYLPLAAVAAALVAGIHHLAGRRSTPVVTALAFAAGFLTLHRNRDYSSPLSIWSDTVAKRLGSVRAHDSLGNALLDAGRAPEAIREYSRALALAPDDPRECYNLGRALAQAGRPGDAIVRYQQALKLDPDYAEAHNNLGVVLAGAGRVEEAVAQYQIVLRLQPGNAGAHYNLGKACQQMGRLPEALDQYQTALRLDPDYAEAYNDSGVILAQIGRVSEAIVNFEEALRLKPAYADAHANFGLVLEQTGRMAEAIAQCESALALKPGDPVVHTNLGIALFQTGRVPEAEDHFQRALQLNPDYAPAHYWLGNALARAGRLSEALDEFQAAVRLAPDDAGARNNLGMALMQTGRLKEAVAQFEAAVRLKPDYATAAGNLADARAALTARNGRD